MQLRGGATYHVPGKERELYRYAFTLFGPQAPSFPCLCRDPAACEGLNQTWHLAQRTARQPATVTSTTAKPVPSGICVTPPNTSSGSQ